MKDACPCLGLKLSGVTYRYAEGPAALEDVSLRVEPGEKLALLGVNGCGKSTLLKILGGLTAPTEGLYEAFGERVTAFDLEDDGFSHWLHRKIGFVFENSDAQLFCPTVREEILFGPIQMGLTLTEAEARLHDVARLMEVEPLMDRSPYLLSAGQKKRVALASVLAVGPDVLLLDEPTNGLDPRSQHTLVHLIGSLNRVGKTIVTTTHDLSILPDVADRVVVLDEGHRLAFEGTPGELCGDPALMLRLNLIHEHAYERLVGREHVPHGRRV